MFPPLRQLKATVTLSEYVPLSNDTTSAVVHIRVMTGMAPFLHCTNTVVPPWSEVSLTLSLVGGVDTHRHFRWQSQEHPGKRRLGCTWPSVYTPGISLRPMTMSVVTQVAALCNTCSIFFFWSSPDTQSLLWERVEGRYWNALHAMGKLTAHRFCLFM